MVFQNPYGSLNPRKTVGAILEEPLAINHRGDPAARQAAARAMMDKVGLRQDQYGRYPHMFSGGQRQRIAIARALMLNPRVVVADEPVSALDVSIQAQVLNLMMDLQDEFRLAYLFISHDLSVVRHIAHEVMVMYCGRPVEQGQRERFSRRRGIRIHACCWRRRRRSIRRIDKAAIVKGELPSPLDPPPGLRVRLALPLCDGAMCARAADPAAVRGQPSPAIMPRRSANGGLIRCSSGPVPRPS